MKKIIVLILLSFIFIACDDDNHTAVQNLQLSISSCELSNQKHYVIVNILKGAGEYKVASSNASVARAVIENDKLYILGFEIGSATITVTDKDNNSATVKIIINESILRITPVTQLIFVKKDEFKILSPQYAGAEYGWGIEDENIISVSGTSENPIIKGNKIGETNIFIIKDFWVVHNYHINVVNQYMLLLNVSNFSLNTGDFSSKMGIIILTGNGSYTVKSSNETVVTAEIKAYMGEFDEFMCNPATVWLTPQSAGNAIITVTDQLTGENRNVNIQIRNNH